MKEKEYIGHLRSLYEGSRLAFEKLLKKCNDEKIIGLAKLIASAKKYSEPNPELLIEYESEMNKMFDATRELNCEKYESDYLSRKNKQGDD